MSQQKFTLSCPQCGSVQFRAARPKPGPDDPLVCAGCGTTVTLADINARIERETRAAMEERLSDLLKPK